MTNRKVGIGNLLTIAATCYIIFKSGCAVGEIRSGKNEVSVVDFPFLKVSFIKKGNED